MLRLTTFGGVALTQDGSAVVGSAGGRRRLALLVLLAASARTGVDRELLCALLWPESEGEQARHSLHQAMYATRRALGAAELFLGTAVVHLNPACIAVDAWEFEAALDAGQLERAAALYAGDFADGLVVEGAPDVERRLEPLRATFARRHATAVTALARAAAERGDHAAHIRWRRTIADADPLSGRAALDLVEALVAAGERAQALRFALLHERLVRQELDAPPDPSVSQWIQRLRAAQTAGPPGADTPAPARAAFATPSEADGHERRDARVARALAASYRVGAVTEEGSIVVTFAATTAAGASPVEVHVVNPRVASVARAGAFVEGMARAARLADPHVHPVLDVGAVEDVLYFVSPRREGETLRDRLRRERELPVADAVRIAREVATALAHAHAHGVHHGDLRPKHVRLTTHGAVVSGFGLVDALAAATDAGQRTTVVALGSPPYLSPEQLAGSRAADARSDVYAAGCVLYEMLTGEPPFGRRASPAALSRKLTQAPAPVRETRDTVPATLERTVMRCVARVPADRYAADELQAQLFADHGLNGP